MCTTSNCSVRRARIVRTAADGSGAIGATDPLVAHGIDLPSGVTPGSGGGPSQGAKTCTTWPMSRKARASARTCIWTPPGIVRLYGHTMPTLITGRARSVPGFDGAVHGVLQFERIADVGERL